MTATQFTMPPVDPSQMTPQQLEAYRAMLGQLQGGAPPGQAALPGGGTMASGNLPSAIPSEAPPVQGGLPAAIPPEAGSAAAGGVPPEPPPSAAAEALGGAAPEGAAAAASPGLLARLLSSPVARTLGGLGLASAAMSNDPGHLPETNFYGPGAGGADKLAQALNPSESDSPAIGLAKSAARGTAKAGEAINDFLFKPKSVSDAEAAAKAPPKAAAASPSVGGPTIDQALGLAPAGDTGATSGVKAGTTFQSQGRGRNPVIDALEGNMQATMPKPYQGGSPAFADQLALAAGEKAMAENTKGLRPGMYGGLQGDAAQREARAQYGMSQAALSLAAQERQSKWALDAAKTGMGLEKENQAEEDASMKVHANHGHFLIEQTTLGSDGKPVKTLMPMDDAYFGIKRGANGGIDPHASITVMGQKFSNLDKDPFAKQALLLGNIQKDGQLSDVMNMPEVSQKIHAATIEGVRSLVGLPGNATPQQIAAEVTRQGIPKTAVAKAQVDAQRGMIFMMMQKNPSFQQKLINMQYDLHNNKGVPGGGTTALENPTGPAPAAGAEPSEPGEDTDYLSQLQTAHEQGN